MVSESGGYLQAVDLDNLIRIADSHQLQILALKTPGEFVSRNEEIAEIFGQADLDEGVLSRIGGCFLVDLTRTPEQDFIFFVRQLVEVALRALSPGINDPHTAENCIDFLSESLSKMARRQMPPRIFQGADGTPRVRIPSLTFQDLVDSAFLQIRQAALDRPDIAIALLRGLTRIATASLHAVQIDVIERHAEMVAEPGLENLRVPHDRKCVENERAQLAEVIVAFRESGEKRSGHDS